MTACCADRAALDAERARLTMQQKAFESMVRDFGAQKQNVDTCLAEIARRQNAQDRRAAELTARERRISEREALLSLHPC